MKMKRYSWILPCFLSCVPLYGAYFGGDFGVELKALKDKMAKLSYRSLDEDFYDSLRAFNKGLADNNTQKNSLLLTLLKRKQDAFDFAILYDLNYVVDVFVRLQGVNINSSITGGVKPIHSVAQRGNKELVEILLSRGVDINTLSECAGQWSPLHHAAHHGRLEVAKYLIEKGADVNREAGSDGATPLMSAITGNSYDTFQLLLNCKDVNLNHRSSAGGTPMIFAAQSGRKKMVNALLDKGANQDLAQNNGVTPFFTACEFGHLLIAKRLVEKGAHVNCVIDNSISPLLAATANGHIQVVQYLLNLPETTDKEVANEDANVTPLFYACFKGHLTIADKLLQAGANPNVKNIVGEGLLHLAAFDQSGYLLKLLSEKTPQLIKGAIDWKTDTGLTPLHYASQEGCLEVIRVLLENGAQIDVTDEYGKTPLFYACQFGQRLAAKKLLTHRANKTIKDEKGRLPIDIAQENKHNDVVRLLEQNTIKPKNKKNNRKAQKKAPKSQSSLSKGKEKEVLHKQVPAADKNLQPSTSQPSLPKEKEKEVLCKQVPAPKKVAQSFSYASAKQRGVQISPALLLDYNVKRDTGTYAVIQQECNDKCKRLIVYKEEPRQDSSCPFELDAEYAKRKEQDMFHGFDDKVDQYLCYGIKIDDPASDLLCKYSIKFPKNGGYAIVLPGKI